MLTSYGAFKRNRFWHTKIFIWTLHWHVFILFAAFQYFRDEDFFSQIRHMLWNKLALRLLSRLFDFIVNSSLGHKRQFEYRVIFYFKVLHTTVCDHIKVSFFFFTSYYWKLKTTMVCSLRVKKVFVVKRVEESLCLL